VRMSLWVCVMIGIQVLFALFGRILMSFEQKEN
jgi:hypothetical protein